VETGLKCLVVIVNKPNTLLLLTSRWNNALSVLRRQLRKSVYRTRHHRIEIPIFLITNRITKNRFGKWIESRIGRHCGPTLIQLTASDALNIAALLSAHVNSFRNNSRLSVRPSVRPSASSADAAAQLLLLLQLHVGHCHRRVPHLLATSPAIMSSMLRRSSSARCSFNFADTIIF